MLFKWEKKYLYWFGYTTDKNIVITIKIMIISLSVMGGNPADPAQTLNSRTPQHHPTFSQLSLRLPFVG